MYFMRSNDLRNSLANLVSQCAIYVAENPKDHALFLKYAAATFVSKLDGVAAERLLTDYDEKMDGLIPEDNDEEFVLYRKALQHVAAHAGRVGYAKKAKTAQAAGQAAGGEQEVDEEAEMDDAPEKVTATPKRTPKSHQPKRRNSATEPLPASNKKQSMLSLFRLVFFLLFVCFFVCFFVCLFGCLFVCLFVCLFFVSSFFCFSSYSS
jgi:hypothetical protein